MLVAGVTSDTGVTTITNFYHSPCQFQSGETRPRPLGQMMATQS